MKITRLGHVVLRVLEDDLKNQHDFAVMEGNAEGNGQGEAAKPFDL